MALPVKRLPRETIEVEGQSVEIRSLSRSEALKITTDFIGNPDGGEIFIISCGTDMPEQDVINWRDTTDPFTVGKVLDAIVAISGLMDGEGKDPK